MNSFLFWLAFVNLMLCFFVMSQLIAAGRTMRRLVDVEPLQGDLPRVSIIVPARNEERDIKPALTSLLHLDYPNMQLMVVNDRSTDRTGEILDEMAQAHPELTVAHVHELPRGWLGKNHALYYGAARADGEWLLFTDADVIMEPTTLRRAIAYAQEQNVDHLPLLFRLRMSNWLAETFVTVFFVFFFIYFRPWKVRDPNSPAYVGVGGFNLIRRRAYDGVGTFQTIAMRPDDDVKLGKIVKLKGFRQDLLVATDHLEVPWYASIRELILGLEKNAFAGVEYRPWVIVSSSLTALIFNVFPFIAVWWTTGWTQFLFASVVGMLWLIAVSAASAGKLRIWPALFFPVGVLLFVYIQWRTMIVNLWHGGIRWRDTLYPLDELKANRV